MWILRALSFSSLQEIAWESESPFLSFFVPSTFSIYKNCKQDWLPCWWWEFSLDVCASGRKTLCNIVKLCVIIYHYTEKAIQRCLTFQIFKLSQASCLSSSLALKNTNGNCYNFFCFFVFFSLWSFSLGSWIELRFCFPKALSDLQWDVQHFSRPTHLRKCHVLLWDRLLDLPLEQRHS